VREQREGAFDRKLIAPLILGAILNPINSSMIAVALVPIGVAFGAPPDLVEDAQRAGLDEIVHSRICFGVASLYVGAPCGPGALDLVGAQPSATLAEAALAAFHEGCIGETTAALLAAERARAAESPELRAVYERIAEDESRHAELAFRFVAWAIAEGGGEVRNALSAAFAALRTSGSPVRSRARDSVLRAHGRLAPRLLGAAALPGL